MDQFWRWVGFPFRSTTNVQATAAIVMALVTTAYAIIAAFQLSEIKTQTNTLTSQLEEVKKTISLLSGLLS